MAIDPTQFATPTLMRAARGAYARSVRAQLRAIGIDDLPRNGAFVLAAIETTGRPRDDSPFDLGVTKQAVSQLVDTLVTRGYVDRSPDPDDRRRITLELTELGQQVVEAVERGVEAVDHQLRERVTPQQIDGARSVLIALANIKSTDAATGAGQRRPSRQLRHFSPIFPVRNLAAALEHYAALGFDSFAYEGSDDYGFANRDGQGVHLAANPNHDPDRDGVAAYLYVSDADALSEEWSRPAIGGHTEPVGATPYQFREGSHVDIDGNSIRFGSPADE